MEIDVHCRYISNLISIWARWRGASWKDNSDTSDQNYIERSGGGITEKRQTKLYCLMEGKLTKTRQKSAFCWKGNSDTSDQN